MCVYIVNAKCFKLGLEIRFPYHQSFPASAQLTQFWVHCVAAERDWHYPYYDVASSAACITKCMSLSTKRGFYFYFGDFTELHHTMWPATGSHWGFFLACVQTIFSKAGPFSQIYSSPVNFRMEQKVIFRFWAAGWLFIGSHWSSWQFRWN